MFVNNNNSLSVTKGQLCLCKNKNKTADLSLHCHIDCLVVNEKRIHFVIAILVLKIYEPRKLFLQLFGLRRNFSSYVNINLYTEWLYSNLPGQHYLLWARPWYGHNMWRVPFRQLAILSLNRRFHDQIEASTDHTLPKNQTCLFEVYRVLWPIWHCYYLLPT